jgi:hypothetical protein
MLVRPWENSVGYEPDTRDGQVVAVVYSTGPKGIDEKQARDDFVISVE